MTYHGRELLVSRSSQKRTFNNSNNRWYSSRLSPLQSLRIECKAEEQHFLGNISAYTINSSLKPIRFTMNEQIKPVKFRSQIVVHNNPETDLHVKRLRVNFHYDDPAPNNTIIHDHSLPLSSARNQSIHIPRSALSYEQTDNTSKRKFRPTTTSQPEAVLHEWINDICANEQLMTNDDIVFFIKNGEFFARI